MAEENLELAVRKVTLGENKVCGLTQPDDAAKAYHAGAVFGGLIFAEQSKRVVDTDSARLVMSGAPLHYVGVFQNQSLEFVAQTANSLGLAAVQLHGEEDQHYVTQLRSLLAEHIAIWKAYGVTDHAPQRLAQHVDRHLLDAQVGNQSGGTGKAFDWSLIGDPIKVMLAGGLNADNAKQAASLGCLGLDFNSGVESAPGKKDTQKLQQAFAAIRNY